MKNKNPEILGMSTASNCGPSKKMLKKRLASEIEAKKILDDLSKNGYIPYEVDVMVRGSILLKIELTEIMLKEAK